MGHDTKHRLKKKLHYILYITYITPPYLATAMTSTTCFSHAIHGSGVSSSAFLYHSLTPLLHYLSHLSHQILICSSGIGNCSMSLIIIIITTQATLHANIHCNESLVWFKSSGV